MAGSERQSVVAGNWKMNGTKALVEEFCKDLDCSVFRCDTIICPPYTLISAFNNDTFALGAQDMSEQSNGAFTGDISVRMLAEVGCNYVIVGHSERREGHLESNQLVARKAAVAIENKITPIVCVGESLETRDAGNVESFINAQLVALIDELGAEKLGQCIIAYEPIWAIGTGKTATPQQAQDVHRFIRETVGKVSEQVASKIRILYGGSVKPDNAAELFAQPDIDGGLIGGASLKVEDFTAICKAAK